MILTRADGILLDTRKLIWLVSGSSQTRLPIPLQLADRLPASKATPSTIMRESPTFYSKNNIIYYYITDNISVTLLKTEQ